MDQLTVQYVHDAMCDGLDVSWVIGRNAGERLLSRDSAPSQRPNLIGPLNLNTANRVQIIGAAEAHLIEDLENQNRHDELTRVINDQTDLLLITDNLPVPQPVATLAQTGNIPLFQSRSSYNDCLNTLRHHLTQFLAPRSIIHGVLMDVLGTGILITGPSGVGKSELALELISRGHILVADDSPEFRRIAPDRIEGSCPALLQDFLEVRGLGVLNIARMYGYAQTRKRKILRFVIRLSADSEANRNAALDRAVGRLQQTRNIHGVEIPEQTLPVAPGRNLAVLVEAAVRNHILVNNGYDATEDFFHQQRHAMEN